VFVFGKLVWLVLMLNNSKVGLWSASQNDLIVFYPADAGPVFCRRREKLHQILLAGSFLGFAVSSAWKKENSFEFFWQLLASHVYCSFEA
jgi:hypothetical protein